MSEELEETYGAWWNTSAGLSARIAGIQNSRGWPSFKIAYDDPTNRNRRIEEYARAGHFKISRHSVKLRALAEIAAGKELEFRFSEHVELDAVSAGKMLGEQILGLLAAQGTQALFECYEMAKEEANRSNPHCKIHLSSVSDMISAFVSFIEQEKRLPDKRELNVHAGRKFRQLKPTDPRWQDGFWEDDDASKIRKKAGFQRLPNAARRT